MKNTLSTIPYSNDDDWDGEYRWWNRHSETNSAWHELQYGDIAALMESQSGEPMEPVFEVSLHLFDEYDFYDGRDLIHAESHSLSVMFWRWGFYLSVRGRQL